MAPGVSIAVLSTPVLLALSATAGASTVPIDQNPVPGSQLTVPLDGTVFDQATGEDVAIQSDLHLVWVRQRNGGGSLQVNVADATAIGQDSNRSYLFTGSDTLIPPNPIAPLDVQFTLIPPNPIISPNPVAPPDQVLVDVTVQLTFSGGGGADWRQRPVRQQLRHLVGDHADRAQHPDVSRWRARKVPLLYVGRADPRSGTSAPRSSSV